MPLVVAAVAVTAACGDDPVEVTDDTPDAPTGVMVDVSGVSLVVTWTASTGATAYDVERAEVAGTPSFSVIAADLTGTTYTDDSATPGTSYVYRVIAKNTDGSSPASDPAIAEIPDNVEVLAGVIDTDVTLDASTEYVITGIVTVDDGGSLTIPAGTLLRGSTAVFPSAVLVRQGGQIFSNGTESDPVVFTSGKDVGEREAGDWGGVVINGRSICNFLQDAGDECVSEGVSGLYGQDPPVEDDDSGVMTYTRIEFAGYEASFGNELNALTLNAVGSGTELHHIQTHYGLDDGFEWFGGTVDLKYALATGISDDSFDYSTGWQGRGQFWIAQQNPSNTESDQGFEVDGNENDPDAEPFTDPLIYNVTLIGGGAGAGNSDVGMLLRLGTAGDIYNAIVMGFQDSGIDIDDAQTVGRFTVQNSIIGDNAEDLSTDADGIDEAALLGDAAWNNLIGSDPNLADPYNVSTPDFRPTAGGNAVTHTAADPPDDGFFTVGIDFIGGVDPDEATPWYLNWTTSAAN